MRRGKSAKGGVSARRRTTRAAGKPRALETALAAFAHEVRTPLTGILALGELLAASELPERERAWAAEVKRAAEHLAQLTTLVVDGVRAGARGLVLREETFRPRQLAESVAATLRARAETKGLQAEVAIADDLTDSVIGDPVRLRAACENLIDNAVKFTERGTVALRVSQTPEANGRVRLTFAISDTGIGLTETEIRRLFRPFSQAGTAVARRFGGAGLGLALVKRLAKAMGGDLSVISEPGRGSTFAMQVLVGANEAAAGAPGASATPAAAGRALRILCAEDNPYGRVVLNTILAELGHRTDFVGTGEAAVAAAATGEYDVVLMDVTLTGLDGIAATRRIRALSGDAARVRIVGISGRSQAREETAARAAGMDDYLVKPVSPSALAKVLGGKAG